MFSATDVISVLGKRGSGKTTLGRTIQRAFPRVVIFDRLHEYNSENTPGAVFCDSFESFAQKIIETVEAKRFKIIYRFDIEKTNHDEELNQALRILWYRGSVLIVIEEVHVFATAHHMPQWLKELILTGRHRGNGILITSQRPAEVHKTLLSQSHHLMVGPMHETNDLNYLRSVLGAGVDKLPRLQQFTFLHSFNGQIKIIKSK